MQVAKTNPASPSAPATASHEGIIERNGIVYDQLFIDPDHCIDCGLCEPECPVDAIFEDDEVPEQWKAYIQINADFYSNGGWDIKQGQEKPRPNSGEPEKKVPF